MSLYASVDYLVILPKYFFMGWKKAPADGKKQQNLENYAKERCEPSVRAVVSLEWKSDTGFSQQLFML